MKKHPTLEELVKERGLKQSITEKNMGVTKSKNGYRYVAVHNDGTYHTFYKSWIGLMKDRHYEIIIVRG